MTPLSETDINDSALGVAQAVAGSICVSQPILAKTPARPQHCNMRPFQRSFTRLVLVILTAWVAAVQSLPAADGRFDRTFRISSPLKVDVVTEAGDISLRVGEPGKMEIHARIQSIDDSQDNDVESRIHAIEVSPPVVNDAKGHSVRIGHFADQNAARNISISYEIVVPAETQLRSETGTGDQTLEGIQGPVDAISGSGRLHVWHVSSDTHVSTGSGDIDLRDIHGKVRAKTGTGTIYASEVLGDLTPSSRLAFAETFSTRTGKPLAVNLTPTGGVDMEIITGSGDVDVENLEGGLQVTSGSGNIRASGKPASDWQLDTGTGTVRVQFPVDANLALIAHTSSGTIESDDAITVQGVKSAHELRGHVGKGGPTVDLKTASGSIEIK
jgi:DUF4097 and DUF4098 domain-containing protein YvlB